MVQYGHITEEKLKIPKSEIKENIQGTNSCGKETVLRSKVWTRRKK